MRKKKEEEVDMRWLWILILFRVIRDLIPYNKIIYKIKMNNLLILKIYKQTNKNKNILNKYQDQRVQLDFSLLLTLKDIFIIPQLK